ncbi:MAG: hypothetical protein NWF07_03975 [Candidatus Bathyarchaeota archaeon]|nr:hypothetical protein [Candidatus Bathyarchaeota archaeon]
MIPDSHSCSFRTGKNWWTYTYLEDRLEIISRHVTFSRDNSETWSEEMASFLILTGSAVDTFFKDMISCPYIENSEIVITQKEIIKNREEDGGYPFWTVDDYKQTFEPIYQLSKNQVLAPYGLDNYGEVQPFANFASTTPSWWSAYNKMKHDYYNKITHATLNNCINSLAGLLLLNALHKCSQEYLILSKHFSDKYSQTNPVHLVEVLQKSMVGIPSYVKSYDPIIKTKHFVYRLNIDHNSKRGGEKQHPSDSKA